MHSFIRAGRLYLKPIAHKSNPPTSTFYKVLILQATAKALLASPVAIVIIDPGSRLPASYYLLIASHFQEIKMSIFL